MSSKLKQHLQTGVSEDVALAVFILEHSYIAVQETLKLLSQVPDTLPFGQRIKIAYEHTEIEESKFQSLAKSLRDYCPSMIETPDLSSVDSLILAPPTRTCLTCVTKYGKPSALVWHNKPSTVKFISETGTSTKLKVSLFRTGY